MGLRRGVVTGTWLCTGVGCSHKPPYEGRSVAELEKMLAEPGPAVAVQELMG